MDPAGRFARALVGAALGAALLTLASMLAFQFLYRDCTEMACLGVVLFVPVAAVASGIGSLVAGSYAGEGWRGYLACLLAAAAGLIVTIFLIRDLRLLLG